MRADIDIKQNVEAELRWTRELDEKDVAVTVNKGVVVLTGFVRSFREKYQAENAAKRIAGVAGVANDIEIRFAPSDSVTDPQIARAAAAAVKIYLPVSWEKVKVLVHNARITLEGEVEWNYQREDVESAVRHLPGVKAVSNLIKIKPRVAPTEIKQKIEAAFRRSAELDAKSISVQAEGSEVTLSGEVSSWAERDEAQRTAWSAPGVTQVTNNIFVSA